MCLNDKMGRFGLKNKRGSYQTVELMGDAHAKDLRVGNNGREPLFQIILFRMFDRNQSSSRYDCVPQRIGVRARLVRWGVIE